MSIKTNHRIIEFYFDPVSPYAWLASTRFEKIIRQTSCEIIAKPILFAGLLNAHGHMGPAEIPAKRNYIFRDVMRRASTYGVEIQGPPNHPFNPLLALRICTAIEDDTSRLKFACAVLDAAWSKGADIADSKTLSKLTQGFGIDSDWALGSTKEIQIKQQLIDATEAAISLGIFGVPTFQLDDQLFWGDDRVDDLIQYSKGQRIDENRLADILKRQAAAKRI